jgi:hypothetical protein
MCYGINFDNSIRAKLQSATPCLLTYREPILVRHSHARLVIPTNSKRQAAHGFQSEKELGWPSAGFDNPSTPPRRPGSSPSSAKVPPSKSPIPSPFAASPFFLSSQSNSAMPSGPRCALVSKGQPRLHVSDPGSNIVSKIPNQTRHIPEKAMNQD